VGDFIDSSKVSLKTVLLYNWDKFRSVSLTHFAKMTGSYENMKLLLVKVQYEKYNWNLRGNLNVIALSWRAWLQKVLLLSV